MVRSSTLIGESSPDPGKERSIRSRSTEDTESDSTQEDSPGHREAHQRRCAAATRCSDGKEGVDRSKQRQDLAPSVNSPTTSPDSTGEVDIAERTSAIQRLGDDVVATCTSSAGVVAMLSLLAAEFAQGPDLLPCVSNMIITLLQAFAALVLDEHGHRALLALVELGPAQVRTAVAHIMWAHRSSLLEIALDDQGCKVVAAFLRLGAPDHSLAIGKVLLADGVAALTAGGSLDVLWAMLEHPVLGPSVREQLVDDPEGLAYHEDGELVARALGIDLPEVEPCDESDE